MFLHMSVILSIGGMVQCMLGYHTPSTRPPLQQTPPGPDPTAGTRHPPEPGTPLGPDPPPAQCILGDTVNKRAVCILQECNLV